MANTTNFGWETPDDTDLVKDGAAAMRTLGNSIDTSFVDLKGGTTNQVLAKNSNTDLDFKWVADATGIPATIFDAKGDLIAASAADTAARLPVGTNGQVLSADSAETTGLKWINSSGWNPDYQLLNTGGTSLSGSGTVTISGISGKNSLFIHITGASSVNANSFLYLRLNSATNTYTETGLTFSESLGATNIFTASGLGGFSLGNMGTATSQVVRAFVKIDGTNTSGLKPVVLSSYASGSNASESPITTGFHSGGTAVTSVSLISNNGNFDAGTIWVYGA